MPITGPRTTSTYKTLGITVEAFKDNITWDKATQCPEDLDIEESIQTTGTDPVTIDNTLTQDNTRKVEVLIVIFSFKSELKLMHDVQYFPIQKIVKIVFI